jgi:hypothetical protein
MRWNSRFHDELPWQTALSVRNEPAVDNSYQKGDHANCKADSGERQFESPNFKTFEGLDGGHIEERDCPQGHETEHDENQAQKDQFSLV